MKTWVPRYEYIAHLTPAEKLRFYQRGKRITDLIAGAGALAWVCVAGLIAGFCVHLFPEWLTLTVILSPLILLIYFLAVNETALLNGSRRIQSEQWQDPQSFSALIEFANILTGRSEYRFRSWAMANLTVVLPLLQEDQYAMLPARERRKLYALITVDAHPDFLLAAIEMLGCFADVEALPTVRKVAEAVAFTPQQREVRQRAQHCVAFLEARVQEKTLEQSLLRGSEANPDTSSILLRSAEGQKTLEAERHELLRANVQQ